MQQQLMEQHTELPQQGGNRKVGQVFASARQELHLSIDDVAQVLHIRKTYISAIEDGNFSELPGYVYTLGFMKKYAEFLDLDFQELQRRLSLETETYSILKVEDLISPYSSPNYKRYVWLSVVVAVLVTSVYTYVNVSRPVVVVLETPPPSVPIEPITPSDPAENTQDPLTGVESTKEVIHPIHESVHAPANQPVLVIRARQPSWISLRDSSGHTLMSRVLRNGERYVVPSLSGLSLDIGNAGGVEMVRDDVVMPSLGKIGQVCKGISIDKIFDLPPR